MIEINYAFVEQIKILNMCWTNQSVFEAIIVPVKGPDEYPIAWVVKRLQKWSLKEIRICTDPESAVVALAKAVITINPHSVTFWRQRQSRAVRVWDMSNEHIVYYKSK